MTATLASYDKGKLSGESPSDTGKKGLDGSYEQLSHKLDSQVVDYLRINGVRVAVDCYSYVVGTFADHVVVCVYSAGVDESYWQIGWTDGEDGPVLTGEPVEVELQTTTEVVERSFVPGVKRLSKGSLAILKEILDDLEDLHKSDMGRAQSALCERCMGKLKALIDRYTQTDDDEDDDDDKPDDMGSEKKDSQPVSPSIDEAIYAVLSRATPRQRALMRQAWDALERAEQINAKAASVRQLLNGGKSL